MQILEKAKLKESLTKWTTFGIGGEADYLIEVQTISFMQEILSFCHVHHLPYLVLGKGSNVLFNDQGFRGVVIVNKIEFIEKITPFTWHVGAGYSFSLLGTQTAREKLSGLEFASGIPASVGGAVFMNAGANGGETCQTLVSVDYISPDGTYEVLLKKDLTFGYRFSSFQDLPGVIVGATFVLTPCTEARKKQLALLHYRTKTQPYNFKSAGCVFKNTSNESAGALIDRLQLKGKMVGGAEVSTLHGNFIVNREGASCEDVLQLIEWIQKEVKDKTGIDLKTEIRHIPYNPKDASHAPV